jgi:hypothetical protein
VQLVQIIFPVSFAIIDKVAQVIPGKDAAVVAVAELELDGVIPNRNNIGDGDIDFAGLQGFLTGPVAALSRWRSPLAYTSSSSRAFWCSSMPTGVMLSLMVCALKE